MAWVRLYTDAPRHHKILQLMSKSKGREAWGVYCFSLAWAGDQLTDGFIPEYALGIVHANPGHVSLLESAGLWIRQKGGWQIHNWDQRQSSKQQLEDAKRKKRKAICERYQREGKHPQECRCWVDGDPDWDTP